jgi:hypothetical protein
MSDFKQYLMDDGSYLTTGVVAEIAGISRIAAYRRLKKSSSKEYVLSLKGSELMTDKARTGRPIGTTRWRDDAVQVVSGIPVNPSYMDGISAKGELPRDRYGKILSFTQQSALADFRRRGRQQWRDNNEGTILDVYDSHKEEMDALKRRRIS